MEIKTYYAYRRRNTPNSHQTQREVVVPEVLWDSQQPNAKISVSSKDRITAVCPKLVDLISGEVCLMFIAIGAHFYNLLYYLLCRTLDCCTAVEYLFWIFISFFSQIWMLGFFLVWWFMSLCNFWRRNVINRIVFWVPILQSKYFVESHSKTPKIKWLNPNISFEALQMTLFDNCLIEKNTDSAGRSHLGFLLYWSC